VIALVLANTLNAGADIGAIAAAINLLVPIPAWVFIVPVSLGIIGLQVFGSYRLIEKVFKWLALALLAYIGAALFAKPEIVKVLAGTLIPTIRLDPAYIGSSSPSSARPSRRTSSSGRQSGSGGTDQHRTAPPQATPGRIALRAQVRPLDTIAGMVFSEVVAYFIILTTGATLFVAGKTDIASATDAAQAFAPLAGDASALLLAVGSSGPACWPCRPDRLGGLRRDRGLRLAIGAGIARSPGRPSSMSSSSRRRWLAWSSRSSRSTRSRHSSGARSSTASSRAPLIILVMLVSNNRARWANAPTAASSMSSAG